MLMFVLAACGADLSSASIRLEPKRFRFDTSGIFWNTAPDPMVTARCTDAADCCGGLRQTVISCQQAGFSCEAAACTVQLSLEQSQPAIFARDIPELALVSEQAWSRISMGEVIVVREEVGPGVHAPALALVVSMAPHAVAPIRQAKAKVIASGQLPSDATHAVLSLHEQADAVLQRYAQTPAEAFVFTIAADVQVAPGGALPRASIDLSLAVALKTGLGF